MTTYHIGLSAHLFSGQAGYRRAGIHGYILNTLHHLPDADPDLRYTVFVGEGDSTLHERLAGAPLALPTSTRPAHRVGAGPPALPTGADSTSCTAWLSRLRCWHAPRRW
jgi:hypothetical protein